MPAERPTASYLPRIREMWVLTVAGETYNKRPAASLVSHINQARRTSISRSVNAGTVALTTASSVVSITDPIRPSSMAERLTLSDERKVATPYDNELCWVTAVPTYIVVIIELTIESM